MRPPHELSAALRSVGLKVTPQRQVLFSLLHQNLAHPSAESLHLAANAVIPGISLRTVYQTLNDLVAMGELQQLQLTTGPARFDPNTTDHHHLVCDGCGEVRDVYVDGLAGVDVQGIDGFRIATTDVVFRGVCASCSSVGASSVGASSVRSASANDLPSTNHHNPQRIQPSHP